jgi:hypothetical protein
MAKSKSARRAKGRQAARRGAKKAARTGARRSAKARSVKRPKTARKAASRKARKAVPAGRRTAAKRGAAKARKGARKGARKTAAKKTTRKAAATPTRTAAAKRPAAAPKAKARKAAPRRAPALDRDRRTVTDTERFPSPPSSLDMDRSASAARTGRAEMVERLHEHTSTSPAMTGGDVDADWESAATVGDEAPGGDNPTPDQDVVDEIGKALGIEYADDEELQGGDEIAERDKKRWELDPASSDDFDDRE